MSRRALVHPSTRLDVAAHALVWTEYEGQVAWEDLTDDEQAAARACAQAVIDAWWSA